MHLLITIYENVRYEVVSGASSFSLLLLSYLHFLYNLSNNKIEKIILFR